MLLLCVQCMYIHSHCQRQVLVRRGQIAETPGRGDTMSAAVPERCSDKLKVAVPVWRLDRRWTSGRGGTIVRKRRVREDAPHI